MKTPSVLRSLVLSAALQLTMSCLTQAQTPAPTATPDKPASEATPAALASASPSAAAASSPAVEQVAPVKQKILDQYDTNHNGILDPDEKAKFDRDRMLRRADRLKKYDKNHDGYIDDAERAVMRADRAAEKDGDKASPKP